MDCKCSESCNTLRMASATLVGSSGLAAIPQPVRRIIRRTGCGIAANPDDPSSVAEAIRSVMHDSDRLQTMARRAREISFSYDKVKQLKIFSETLEDAVRE